jgi:hypothetical protein
MVAPAIHEGDVDALLLDPLNPRLRRAPGEPLLSQPDLLRAMVAWELDELIVSYAESGFWKHEPLIVVEEHEKTHDGDVVVEGNRRVAALKCLRAYLRGEPVPSRRITRVIEEALADADPLDANSSIFTEVPFVRYASRRDIDAYLGFRHVTGVKQWEPQEKATFIAHLIDRRHYDYRGTAKLIGTKTEIVRRNYVAYHLLNEFEELTEEENSIQALERARDDFSVFFLSLREEGIRQYLNISLDILPQDVPDAIKNLDRHRVDQFLVWMFGSDAQDSLIGESRNIKKFAEILSTPEALAYITSRPDPSFDIAYGMTKGASDDIVAALKESRELLRNVLADLDLSENADEITQAAWPVVSAAAEIAKRLGGETIEKLRAAVCNARES